MRVKPSRNKTFVCDECGEEVSTTEDYSKVILVRFVDGQKFRNKFCSVKCLDKWSLVNKQVQPAPESLEEELKVEVYDRDEESEEEEPYVPGIPAPAEKAKSAAYANPSPGEYYAEPESAPKIEHFDQAAEIKDDASDLNKIKSGYFYEKKTTGRKLFRMSARTPLEKFRDRLKAWGVIYDRDDWK